MKHNTVRPIRHLLPQRIRQSESKLKDPFVEWFGVPDETMAAGSKYLIFNTELTAKKIFVDDNTSILALKYLTISSPPPQPPPVWHGSICLK
ncbi:hypothetical protein [Tritonibacter horizontis]|uniref:hypothetical protein n=1 Tax=Tritonibacter horizontis TaxID=1768241 RepID=UPI00082FA4A2|nr:hypothetical protein [Tritonibacter horizontis]